jgi:cytoskeleton protein RodZ
MSSVGETLRAERLKRKLGLDQISGELKISSRFLEAIETEQFDKLPGGVFTKSFVRQYARLLGLDDEDLADQVQRVLEPQPGVPQFAEKPNLAASGFHLPKTSEFHVPKMEAWESVGENRFRWSGSLSAAALFVVALLICSGVYTWIERPRSAGSARVVSRPPAAVPKPIALPPPSENTAAENTAAENTALQPPPQSASPEPQKTPPAVAAVSQKRNATVRVEVTADEAVWMLARTDGKYAFSGTLDAHQSRTVEASGNILLRFGNAGAVTVTLNGKPLGPMGPKGQVRTVQFTSGGFQTVPDKVPAAVDRF